jgi:hypothetical protein
LHHDRHHGIGIPRQWWCPKPRIFGLLQNHRRGEDGGDAPEGYSEWGECRRGSRGGVSGEAESRSEERLEVGREGTIHSWATLGCGATYLCSSVLGRRRLAPDLRPSNLGNVN